MTNPKDLARQRRMIGGARRYAAADRTDPFAFSRAMTHIDIGLATSSRGKSGMDRDYGVTPATAGYYDAEMVREVVKMRGAGGEEIDVERVTYKSVVRP